MSRLSKKPGWTQTRSRPDLTGSHWVLRTLGSGSMGGWTQDSGDRVLPPIFGPNQFFFPPEGPPFVQPGTLHHSPLHQSNYSITASASVLPEEASSLGGKEAISGESEDTSLLSRGQERTMKVLM
ncbi:hypothetical protein SAY87_024837 [Trapa incisa]|uniref:Uncharacterized protein n=1 Tax=Trapa incisa TaxID=236973 RepID=A0AAN7JFD5_9MYRT|nr:hypothetical protein SAY87_024837 [Trapa incisa]